jgi:hypothetical protein
VFGEKAVETALEQAELLAADWRRDLVPRTRLAGRGIRKP